MRIFVAVDLDPEIRDKITRFLDGVRGFAPDVRWVRPESLHITLKFIGEQKLEGVEAVRERLKKVEGQAFEIHVAGHGFFPTAKAARVLWIGIQAGPRLASLAAQVDAAVAEIGVPRDDRPYSPHLTLARGSRSGSSSPKWRKENDSTSNFGALDKRLAAMSALDFGTMTAREFFLYQSQLSPGGSKYTKLQSFSLKSSMHT